MFTSHPSALLSAPVASLEAPNLDLGVVSVSSYSSPVSPSLTASLHVWIAEFSE